jgi:hypothetical protein
MDNKAIIIGVLALAAIIVLGVYGNGGSLFAITTAPNYMKTVSFTVDPSWEGVIIEYPNTLITDTPKWKSISVPAVYQAKGTNNRVIAYSVSGMKPVITFRGPGVDKATIYVTGFKASLAPTQKFGPGYGILPIK